MTLATKNGSLILKDGSIAENCGCCGGWYCYNQCADFSCPGSASVSVSISASDTLTNIIWRYAPQLNFSGLPTYWQRHTLFSRGSEINGVHSLVSRPDLSTASSSVWESSSSFWSDCGFGGINQMSSNRIRLTLFRVSRPSWLLQVPVAAFLWQSENLSAEPAASGFKVASDFSCSSLCERCSSRTADKTIQATCQSNGAITIADGFSSSATFPISFGPVFPAQGMSSDYFRTVVYSSGPLLFNNLPDVTWQINSVTFS